MSFWSKSHFMKEHCETFGTKEKIEKMKKYGIKNLVLFLLLVVMAGCTSNNHEEAERVVIETSESQNQQPEEVKDSDEMEENVEEIAESTETEDATAAMIEEADYIAKVKLITRGQKTTELKILQNIKGVISENAVPNLELQKNRAYLVFLKEEENNVTLVEGDDSVILLEGNQNELFKKINKQVYR